MNRVAGTIVPLLCAIVAGCGGSAAPSGPPAYPVKGKVVFKDDNQPMSGGSVSFVLTTDSSKNGQGEIGSNGEFTVFHIEGNKKVDGLLEGTYKATVIPPQGSKQTTQTIELKTPFKVTAAGPNEFTLEVPGTKPK